MPLPRGTDHIEVTITQIYTFKSAAAVLFNGIRGDPPSRLIVERRMTDEACDAVWAELRARRTAYLVSMLGLPGAVLAAMLLERWLPLSFMVPMAAALASYVATGKRLSRWPCPRCGESFSARQGAGRTIPLPGACVHCGLPYEACEW